MLFPSRNELSIVPSGWRLDFRCKDFAQDLVWFPDRNSLVSFLPEHADLLVSPGDIFGSWQEATSNDSHLGSASFHKLCNALRLPKDMEPRLGDVELLPLVSLFLLSVKIRPQLFLASCLQCNASLWVLWLRRDICQIVSEKVAQVSCRLGKDWHELEEGETANGLGTLDGPGFFRGGVFSEKTAGVFGGKGSWSRLGYGGPLALGPGPMGPR